MNSGFLLTDAGLAKASISSPTGPHLQIGSFRAGTGVGYTPTRSQTGLQGTTVYQGVPQSYTVEGEDTVDVLLVMPANVGPFSFGEIGLYDPQGNYLATCVFDTLQSKTRAVGNQAGNVWRLHSKLKMAQAPAIVEVVVTNSITLLEVANWQSLALPVDQPSGANAAIIHEQNMSKDSVIVVRENDNEWATPDYIRLKDITGATTSDLTVQHPDIGGLVMPAPQDSRYIVKFSNGQIRKVTAKSGEIISFSPSLGFQAPTSFSVWEDTESHILNMTTKEISLNRYYEIDVGRAALGSPDVILIKGEVSYRGVTPLRLRYNTLTGIYQDERKNTSSQVILSGPGKNSDLTGIPSNQSLLFTTNIGMAAASNNYWGTAGFNAFGWNGTIETLGRLVAVFNTGEYRRVTRLTNPAGNAWEITWEVPVANTGAIQSFYLFEEIEAARNWQSNLSAIRDGSNALIGSFWDIVVRRALNSDTVSDISQHFQLNGNNPGWLRLPNGWILQWGTVTVLQPRFENGATRWNTTFNLPRMFPNGHIATLVSTNGNAYFPDLMESMALHDWTNQSQISIYNKNVGDGGTIEPVTATYYAVGV